MDTTATIPTGSMAERWKWKSFVLWGLFCGALYYPLVAGWTWGGGWMSQLGNSMDLGFGYVDFAGSGVVHTMGGMAALTGALVLGPRIGKFGKDGKPRALPGHHIPMAMLGTFILLFGWFGFNAASTFAATDIQFAVVATNTAIAGAFGAIIAMVWIMMRTGKPDPGMMANGMLAGLVAITAPCAFVSPWAAAVIGCIAGVLVIESIFIVEKKFKIDDPVGAISVHGINGLFGVLCVGLFANGTYGSGWNLTESSSHRRPRRDWSPRLRRCVRRRSRGQAAADAGHRLRRAHRRRRRSVLRLLQDPELASPRAASGPARKTSWRASTCPRWVCRPTPSSPERSAATARAMVARWSRHRSTPDMSHGGGRSRVLRPPRPRLRCGRRPVCRPR